MMSLIKDNQKITNQQSNDDKKKKREERCKGYKEAPICNHCGKKKTSVGNWKRIKTYFKK